MMKALEITTQIGCINCSYCPQDKLKAAYKSRIKKIGLNTFMDCIRKLPREIDIHFSGFSEPFLHKDITYMIDYAKMFQHTISIFTTLTGFTKEHAEFLQFHGAKFKDFFVHAPVSGKTKSVRNLNKKTRFLVKYKIPFKYIFIKDEFDSNNKTKQCGEDIFQYKITRAGNLKDSGKYLLGPIKCSKNRQYQNVLLPNGDVVLCCMDWNLEYKLGNLLTDSVDDLYKSEAFLKIKNGMKSRDDDIICRKCENAVNI